MKLRDIIVICCDGSEERYLAGLEKLGLREIVISSTIASEVTAGISDPTLEDIYRSEIYSHTPHAFLTVITNEAQLPPFLHLPDDALKRTVAIIQDYQPGLKNVHYEIQTIGAKPINLSDYENITKGFEGSKLLSTALLMAAK